jgi:hypothetical protein
MGMTRSRTVTRAGLLFGGVLLVASGCSSSGGGSALSKDDFLKQGNAICDAGNKEIAAADDVFETSSEEPQPEAIKAFLKDKLIPSVTRQIDAIDKLKPPKDLEAAVDKLVKDAKAALDELKKKADSDPASVFAGSDPFADANKEASAIGLTACGAGSEDSGSSDSSSS